MCRLWSWNPTPGRSWLVFTCCHSLRFSPSRPGQNYHQTNPNLGWGLRRDMRPDYVYGWSCCEMWEWDCLMSGFSPDIYTSNLLHFALGRGTLGQDSVRKLYVSVRRWGPIGWNVLIKSIPSGEVSAGTAARYRIKLSFLRTRQISYWGN